MTAKEVLAAKPVAYPLTRPMCAPVGDGAAAAIVCSEKFLKKLTNVRPVRIRASILGRAPTATSMLPISESVWRKRPTWRRELVLKTSHIAEVHDATSWGELHQTESMGFCPMGEGGPFAESGATKLEAKCLVKTQSGLECKGHPIGASGLSQIYELVTQLRGEAGKRQVKGARLALAENGGGNMVSRKQPWAFTYWKRCDERMGNEYLNLGRRGYPGCIMALHHPRQSSSVSGRSGYE